MKKNIFISLFLFLSMFVCSHAFALTVLQDQEAAQYLGEPEKHFLASSYSYEVLSRSHRDAMHGRFSDAIIFNPGGGLFDYLRRKDGDHRVVLDSTNGREEDPVNAEDWRKKISNNLSDDNNRPVVFLDDSGKEMAVVFTGNGAKVDGKMTDDGHLLITVAVDGAKDTQGRRRRMM